MGILNDEGKLDWDTPVREYLPGFRLFDPVASAEMTPRDLVIHDSGLPRHDLLWYGSDLKRQELFERLRYLEPNKPFRSTYQYQNLMFMTAGYLVGQITDSTWEDVVRQSNFEPLGMSRANFSVEHSQQDEDFAYPYAEIEETVTRIPFRNLDEIGPAGSINSSVMEMIRYVEFHINKGKHGEQQLLSEKNARTLQTPQMVITGPLLDYYGKFPEVELVSYGLGLSMMSYRGHKLVRHGGGIDGFISGMAWLPEEKIGVVVLTNYSGTGNVPRVVIYEVVDRLLDLEPIDWNERFLVTYQEEKAKEKEAEEKEKAAHKQGTSPSHSLEDYVGTFEHSAYGTVTVASEGSGLTFSFSSLTWVTSSLPASPRTCPRPRRTSGLYWSCETPQEKPCPGKVSAKSRY